MIPGINHVTLANQTVEMMIDKAPAESQPVEMMIPEVDQVRQERLKIIKVLMMLLNKNHLSLPKKSKKYGKKVCLLF